MTHVRLSHRTSSNGSDGNPSSSASPSGTTTPLTCDDCAKTFRTKHTLKRHILNHCPYFSARSQSRSPSANTDIEVDHSASSPSEITHATINPTPSTQKIAHNDNTKRANKKVTCTTTDTSTQDSINSPQNLPTLKPLPPHLTNQQKQLK